MDIYKTFLKVILYNTSFHLLTTSTVYQQLIFKIYINKNLIIYNTYIIM